MTEDDAKEFAIANVLFPDYLLEQIIAKADSRFVVWDLIPPSGVSYKTHKLSFINALISGLSHCATNCHDAWTVLGPVGLYVVRALPQFIEKPERSTGKMTYVGKLSNVSVYAHPSAKRNLFWVGRGEMCCAGTIHHGLIEVLSLMTE